MSEEKNFDFERRKWVLAAVTVGIVAVYMCRILYLQLMSEDFRVQDDSNAFYHRVQYATVRGSSWCTISRLMTSWW